MAVVKQGALGFSSDSKQKRSLTSPHCLQVHVLTPAILCTLSIGRPLTFC